MKFLFIKSKYLCYNSNSVFMSAMESALHKMGVQVQWCEIMEEKTAASELEKLIGQSFDAVIDFNSNLPLAVTQDGISFPDLIDAPFYNYIVDHPMFHHAMINLPLKDYHIICIDRNHQKYVEALYPNIKSTTFLPLAAMTALQEVPFEKKKPIILFPGTFMPSKEHYDVIQQCDKEKKFELMELVDRLLSEPAITLEKAAAEMLARKGKKLTPEQFKNQMLLYYRADYYVRTYNREQLIEGLLKAELPVEVLGCGWEAFQSPYATRLKIREGVGYAFGLQMIANAMVALNVQPLFKDGIHDRVLSAMANRTLAVTDTSTYIEECFTDREDLLLYQPRSIDKLAESLWNLLENPEKMEKIATSGCEKVKKEHTWEQRMKEFVKR